MTKLYFVIPCYNEEEVISETVKRLIDKYNFLVKNEKISEDSRVLFVDDGSKDKTWSLIVGYSQEYKFIECLKLSKNRGHQNALLAGLMQIKDKCDCAISMDADLQDDINAVDDFICKYEQGAQVVYGVRNQRDEDTAFKRGTASFFYKVMSFLGADIVYNHADYRLMSNKALKALAEYKEVNLFLRGIVPLIGFNSDYVYYNRKARFAGESKYPFKKMLYFAVDGITSFSVKPLKMISSFGIIISASSILGLIYAFVSYITGSAVSGWTAIVMSIWLLGGIQMLCLGVVGTYVGKIYSEVKARPKYIIEEYVENNDKED